MLAFALSLRKVEVQINRNNAKMENFLVGSKVKENKIQEDEVNKVSPML